MTHLLRLAELCVTELRPQLGKGTAEYVAYATDMCAFLSALAIISTPEEWVEARETILLATYNQRTSGAIN